MADSDEMGYGSMAGVPYSEAWSVVREDDGQFYSYQRDGSGVWQRASETPYGSQADAEAAGLALFSPPAPATPAPTTPPAGF